MLRNDDQGDSLSSNAGKIIAVILCGLLGLTAFLALTESLGAAPSTLAPMLPALLLAIIPIIGWMARTSNARHYFTSSRTIPAVSGALSSLAAWFSVMPFLVMSGGLTNLGFDGLAFAIGPIAGLVIAGVLITPYLAQSGSETVAQFIGKRFGNVAQAIAALIILIASALIFASALQAAGWFGWVALGVPLPLAIGLATSIVVLSVLPGGVNGGNWTGMAFGLVTVIALAVAGAVCAAKLSGVPSAQVAVASTLKSITDLEYSLIEKGLASATSLKSYTKPFGHFGSDLFLLIALTLAVVTAALPMLLQRSLAQSSLTVSRSSTAWLIAFAVYVALSAVAWAAFSKVTVYKMIEKQTTFAALPNWVEPLSQSGTVRIHGVSLQLFDRVAETVLSGAKTPAAVGAALGEGSPDAKAWASLKDSVKAAFLASAEAIAGSATLPPDYGWQSVRESILPVAAKAAGNKTGFVTLPSLEIDGAGLIAALPAIAGVPGAVISLAIAGLLSIPLAVAGAAAALAATALNRDLLESILGSDRAAGFEPRGTKACMVLVVLAGFVMAEAGANLGGATAFSLALVAATLFPLLIAGLWMRRTNCYGAVAGLVTGAAIASYLGLPVVVSNGGALEAWRLLAQHGAVVLAVPAALTVTVLVSLVTPWPSSEQDGVVSAARGMALPTEL